MYLPILRVHLKTDKRMTYQIMLARDLRVCVCVLLLLFFVFFVFFLLFFFLISFMKAYAVDTHLNCIDKSMQFKWVPTAYAFTK